MIESCPIWEGSTDLPSSMQASVRNRAERSASRAR
jgi:hypothetical protein